MINGRERYFIYRKNAKKMKNIYFKEIFSNDQQQESAQIR